eukprot:IDg8684t1
MTYLMADIRPVLAFVLRFGSSQSISLSDTEIQNRRSGVLGSVAERGCSRRRRWSSSVPSGLQCGARRNRMSPTGLWTATQQQGDREKK